MARTIARTLNTTTRTTLLAAALALPSFAWAETSGASAPTDPAVKVEIDTTPGMTTTQEVRDEIGDAFAAVGDYAAQERKQALASAREAMQQLDAEIDRRQEALRENWADLSAAARERGRATLRDLQQARYRIGERYGALEAGADSAWDDLKQGFVDAYGQLKAYWTEEDPAPKADS